jgi:thiamine pyrophosphate-dependent acetolactate synthase large subunit-like protein
MNLGSLVTVGAANPANLTVVVLENHLYEVTGGQQTPGPAALLDFAKIAEGSGFETIAQFYDIEKWREQCREFLHDSEGPRFVTLGVGRTPQEYLKHPTPPIAEQLERFRAALS